MPTRSSEPGGRRRPVQFAGALLLLGWGVIGALGTPTVISPSFGGTPHARGVVGVPTAFSPDVTAVRRLLLEWGDAGDTRAVVVLSPEAPPLLAVYMRYQLAHLEFPRQVDVVVAGDAIPGGRVKRIIAGPGLSLPADWKPLSRNGGYALYRVLPE